MTVVLTKDGLACDQGGQRMWVLAFDRKVVEGEQGLLQWCTAFVGGLVGWCLAGSAKEDNPARGGGGWLRWHCDLVERWRLARRGKNVREREQRVKRKMSFSSENLEFITRRIFCKKILILILKSYNHLKVITV